MARGQNLGSCSIYDPQGRCLCTFSIDVESDILHDPKLVGDYEKLVGDYDTQIPVCSQSKLQYLLQI